MKRARWAGLLAVGVLALPGPEARAVEQAAIDRAIDKGVAGLRRMQQRDGTWSHANIGATALAGLTLRECGARADDKAVRQAAAAVRQASLTLNHTYSLALAVLFLDGLGDPADTPLIESMLVRLLAGQNLSGGWAYTCPESGAAEVRRLTASVRRINELVARRELPKLPARGKRTVKDLPKEIQDQLAVLQRVGPAAEAMSDNSNTQFATLALWVGRRYGLPVQEAMNRIGARFRRSQFPDGSWGYLETGVVRLPRVAPGVPGPPGSTGTATMTCAGLLGLAAAHGSAADLKRARNPKAKPRDIGKDAQLRAGLQALATAVGRPTGARKAGGRVALQASGKAYYFLWSLERVAVALNLETIGKKDWYNWGAEVLLANQQPDGSWQGEYGGSGADTCFALLFLKRANLAADLTASISGATDPGEKVLRSGGVGGGAFRGAPAVLKPTDIGGKAVTRPDPKPAHKVPKAPPRAPEESAAGRLGRELVAGSAERRRSALERLRESKGVAYTEALVGAIPRLEGELKGKAREALAERLARMKTTTLRTYLKDEEAELRRAAALACASKESKELIPDLILLLGDPEPVVGRAAHVALKDLSGKNFGPSAGATRAERDRAVAEWQAWWRKQTRE